MPHKTRGGYCRYCNQRIMNNFKRHMRSCRRKYLVQPAHQSISWNPRPIETGLTETLPVQKEIEGKVIKTTRIERDTPHFVPPPPPPANVSILDMMKFGIRQATISQKIKDLQI